MATENFFQDLPSFSNFNELTQDSHFRHLPEDWKVIVADIRDSTKAIESGRYKDVNTLGAAAIVAAQNAMGKSDLPFVFGGDGATLTIPPGFTDRVTSALDGVRALAREKFDMSLRVGLVEVAELYKEGYAIEVAKFRLFANKTIAMFRGSGFSKAEEMIKKNPKRYSIGENQKHASDLNGLSCRWQPIPSKKGKILSLLVSARSKAPKATYEQILRKLDSILNGNIETANPVHSSDMRYKSLSQVLGEERRYHRNLFSLSFLRRVFEIFAAILVFRFKIPSLVFDPNKYASSLSSHSDFRKFDDTLRIVVDCSKDQVGEILSYLEGLYQEHEICYGVHESDQALMTCFVYGVEDGQHIHFIDGGDGGYAMAAKQLKTQLKE